MVAYQFIIFFIWIANRRGLTPYQDLSVMLPTIREHGTCAPFTAEIRHWITVNSVAWTRELVKSGILSQRRITTALGPIPGIREAVACRILKKCIMSERRITAVPGPTPGIREPVACGIMGISNPIPPMHNGMHPYCIIVLFGDIVVYTIHRSKISE